VQNGTKVCAGPQQQVDPKTESEQTRHQDANDYCRPRTHKPPVRDRCDLLKLRARKKLILSTPGTTVRGIWRKSDFISNVCNHT